MRIYLVQHGEALDKSVDPDRPLSDEGRHAVDVVGEFLREKMAVDEIWHSGKLRAEQTAERFSQLLVVTAQVVRHEGLKAKDPVLPIVARVAEASGDVMLVGHMPFMQKLASLLVCGDEEAEAVAFNKGGVVCITSQETGYAVEWAVTPALLGV